MIITGCITKIGASSDGSPCGADGKLVMQRQMLLRPYPRGLAGMNDSGRGREVR